MKPSPSSKQHTLYGDIFDWLLTPLLLVVWPAGLGLTWLVAQNFANKPYDHALESNAHALAQQVQIKGHRAQLNLPRPAQDILRADGPDQVYYQVLGLSGELLAGERDFPAPPEDEMPMPSEVRLRTDRMRGKGLRVAYVWVHIEEPQHQAVLVQVGETLAKRSNLASDLIQSVMLPQVLTLLFTVFLVWLGLTHALRPLHQLARRVRERRPDDLSPLDNQAVPQEVAPLVSSINDLLEKLQHSMETQKRFLTDAAHQLKTPLAGLRMQADLALRDGGNEAALKHSLEQMAHSSVRATHTVNQLLALARAKALGHSPSHQWIDLSQLASEVVRDSVPHALDKRIDLGYEGPDQTAWIHGQPTLLQELIRNLVDNAIRYTPQGGRVTARVRNDRSEAKLAGAAAHKNSSVWLEVEDNGPGIPPAERELVFQPFYRALGTHVDGSGLGLSIVQEIAAQHQAELRLEETHPGQTPAGTLFRLRFQAALAAPPSTPS